MSAIQTHFHIFQSKSPGLRVNFALMLAERQNVSDADSFVFVILMSSRVTSLTAACRSETLRHRRHLETREDANASLFIISVHRIRSVNCGELRFTNKDFTN